MLRALAALALLAVACVGPGPVVDHRVHDVKDGALTKVAVVPFYALPGSRAATRRRR